MELLNSKLSYLLGQLTPMSQGESGITITLLADPDPFEPELDLDHPTSQTAPLRAKILGSDTITWPNLNLGSNLYQDLYKQAFVGQSQPQASSKPYQVILDPDHKQPQSANMDCIHVTQAHVSPFL